MIYHKNRSDYAFELCELRDRFFWCVKKHWDLALEVRNIVVCSNKSSIIISSGIPKYLVAKLLCNCNLPFRFCFCSQKDCYEKISLTNDIHFFFIDFLQLPGK